MRTQNFGIEIELTGITRERAAEVIAEYFGTESFYIGTYYKTYGAKDRQGRTWKATYDSSQHHRTEKGAGAHGSRRRELQMRDRKPHPNLRRPAGPAGGGEAA